MAGLDVEPFAVDGGILAMLCQVSKEVVTCSC